MFNVSCVLERLDDTIEEDDVVEPAALLELATSAAQWKKNVYKKYSAIVPVGSRLFVSNIVFPDTDPIDIDLTIDETLFIQLAKLYLYWGWPTINAIYHESSLTDADDNQQRLLQETCVFLRNCIAIELNKIEAGVSKLAQSMWTESETTLQGWKNYFKPITKSKFVFSDRAVAKSVIPLCEQYQMVFHSLELSIKQRSRASKYAENYVPGENDELYSDLYRTWGKRELELRDELKIIASQLGKHCPPALFALQVSTTIFATANTTSVSGKTLRYSYHESTLATEIMSTMEQSIAGLKRRITNAKSRGIAAAMQAPGALPGERTTQGKKHLPSAESVLAHWCLKEWGTGAAVKRFVMIDNNDYYRPDTYVFDEDHSNVMGFGNIVQEYKTNQGLNEGTSLQRCVITHYLHALDSEINVLRFKSEQFSTALKIIRVVAAIVAVIAVIALIVMSGGSLMPGGVATVCAIIQFADNAINIALLAILALETKIMDEGNAKGWQDAIAELNTRDISTINQVGSALLNLHNSRIDITRQLVLLLVKLKAAKFSEKVLHYYGVSNKLNLVQRAMDIENLTGDLETVVEGAQAL